MAKLKEWIQKNFALKPGDPEKQWAKEIEAMRDAIPIIAAVNAPLPSEMNMGISQYLAMVAAGFALVRRKDDDWKRLSPETAWRLYIGIATAFIEMGAKVDEIKAAADETKQAEEDGNE